MTLSEAVLAKIRAFRITPKPPPPPFRFTAAHRESLKHLHFIWLNAESGAPWVNEKHPLGSPDPARDLSALLLPIRRPSAASIQRLLSTIHLAFQVFLAHGRLKPGVYRVVNRLSPRGLRVNLDIYTKRTLAIPGTELLDVTVTTDHLRLMRNANTYRSASVDELGIHPKRPYGDMMMYYRDMREILKSPKASTAALARLHGEMLTVLLAFLQFAQLAEGTYARDTHCMWRKVANR
jgi:hypothetical protein